MGLFAQAPGFQSAIAQLLQGQQQAGGFNQQTQPAGTQFGSPLHQQWQAENAAMSGARPGILGALGRTQFSGLGGDPTKQQAMFFGTNPMTRGLAPGSDQFFDFFSQQAGSLNDPSQRQSLLDLGMNVLRNNASGPLGVNQQQFDPLAERLRQTLGMGTAPQPTSGQQTIQPFTPPRLPMQPPGFGGAPPPVPPIMEGFGNTGPTLPTLSPNGGGRPQTGTKQPLAFSPAEGLPPSGLGGAPSQPIKSFLGQGAPELNPQIMQQDFLGDAMKSMKTLGGGLF